MTLGRISKMNHLLSIILAGRLFINYFHWLIFLDIIFLGIPPCHLLSWLWILWRDALLAATDYWRCLTIEYLLLFFTWNMTHSRWLFGIGPWSFVQFFQILPFLLLKCVLDFFNDLRQTNPRPSLFLKVFDEAFISTHFKNVGKDGFQVVLLINMLKAEVWIKVVSNIPVVYFDKISCEEVDSHGTFTVEDLFNLKKEVGRWIFLLRTL